MAGFKFDTSGLRKGLDALYPRLRASLSVYAQTCAKRFESEAKKNYPWTDRSYMASKTLHGDYQWRGDIVRITLEHGVDYGIYLEFCNAGKYAIVWPTVKDKSLEAMKGLRGLLGG